MTQLQPLGAGSVAVEDGANLFDDVVTALQRYVVFPCPETAWTIALWVLHTYVYDAFDTTPYLEVMSPTKQAGKSRLFEVLGLLVARPYTAVGTTEAVLFRKIHADHPTLLLDEIDATFGKDAKLTQGIRGVLNGGYRRNGVIARCVGLSHDVKDYSIFCPKAFAGIGDALPDTVRDRSIPIRLRRRATNEPQPARFRERHAREELAPLAARIKAFAEGMRDRIARSTPELPNDLGDRQQDAWEPLLAIADLASGDWPKKARNAAVQLHGTRVEGDIGLLLLEHIRDAFDAEKQDELSTKAILDFLVDRGDDSPWARWWSEDLAFGRSRGPASQMARHLKPHGVESEQLWVKGQNVRGYKRSSFTDVWNRYWPEPREYERQSDV